MPIVQTGFLITENNENEVAELASLEPDLDSIQHNWMLCPLDIFSMTNLKELHGVLVVL